MKIKKIITVILAVVVLLTTLPVAQLSVSAQTNHTQAEAVSWITARKNEGWAQDKDGAYGAQCVDLIHYYLDFWGVPRYSGNAYSYTSKALPSGWSYQSTPAPGDIAVWAANKGFAAWTGHVALVQSVSGGNFSYVDVNGATGRAGSGTIAISNATTFIRPLYSSSASSASVSFKPWSNGNYTFIGETNAAIGQEITVSNGSCGENGMVLYDSNGVQLATGKNPTYTLARVYFNINLEMGYTLKPGTKYQYKFYAVVNGKTYWSNMQSFTTSGTAPHSHNYNQKNTNNKYLKSSANCTSAAVYYYSCSCGEKSGNTFTSGNALGHDYKETAYDTYKEYKCSRCGNSYKENIEAPVQQVKTYTLTYNANGGTNAPVSQTQTENGRLSVSGGVPSRNGYNFKGWSESVSSSSVSYYGGDSIIMRSDITLYAVWEEIVEEEIEEEYIEKYWLFYDANGGVGAPAPVTEEEGIRVTITSKKPTRSGYNFLGWSENENAYNAEYESGDKIVLNYNVTLYAIWEKMSIFSGNSIPSDWALAEIEAAINEGIVPENLQKNYTMPVYRLEVAGMFINLIEEVSGKSINTVLRNNGVSRNSNAFTDTDDKNVLAANALGIINGVGNKLFDPYGTLTRGEITAIINRTAKVLGIKTSGYSHNFVDVDNHWCKNELGWAYNKGIINGVGDNCFAPNDKLTTEQAIAITYRAFKEIK